MFWIILKSFEKNKLDAGVVCFETVHPRWSYVRMDNAGNVVEASEKRPISKNAIAGIYYFNKGKHFVEAAMRSISKDANFNGLYYVSLALNEMVLANQKIGIHTIPAYEYHTFYSPAKIHEYEQKILK